MDIREYERFRSRGAHRHPWEIARARIISKILARALRSEFDAVEGMTVLDIGCGDAFLLGTLATSFPQGNFLGVDAAFTEENMDEISKVLPAGNVHLAHSVDELDIGACRLQAILLLDVLEHIEDDTAFLKKMILQDLLQQGGFVLITVPAFQHLFSGHDKRLGHFRRYRRRSLFTLAESAGLKVRSCHYTFTSLYLVRLLQKALSPSFRREQPVDTAGISSWRRGKAITSMITSLLKLDYSLGAGLSKLKINLFGLSCVALCQKH